MTKLENLRMQCPDSDWDQTCQTCIRDQTCNHSVPIRTKLASGCRPEKSSFGSSCYSHPSVYILHFRCARRRLEGLLKKGADLECELKQVNQTSHNSMLMGGTEDYKLSAFAKTRIPSAASTVDWAAALTAGSIHVFVKSVRKTIYENGGSSSMFRFLQAIFGAYLASESEAVHTGKGGKSGAWGAVPSFEIFAAIPPPHQHSSVPGTVCSQGRR
jgi:hypothetical protein